MICKYLFPVDCIYDCLLGIRDTFMAFEERSVIQREKKIAYKKLEGGVQEEGLFIMRK